MYTTSTVFQCIQLFLNADILEMILQMCKDIDLSNFIDFFLCNDLVECALSFFGKTQS